MQGHGSYKIELYNQVVIVRLFDDWNNETSTKMCEDFIEIAKGISQKPWACLVDLSNWGLGGPEVWEPILEVNRWCSKNNQKHEAVICSKKLQEHLVKHVQETLLNVESEFFKDEEDAKLWLNKRGYEI